MKHRQILSTLCLASALCVSCARAQAPTSQPAGAAPAAPEAPTTERKFVTKSGVTIVETGHDDLSAATAQVGDYVWMDYTGKLENGTKFDSSADHPGQALVFRLGHGEVIRGWDEGIQGMKVGDKRVLTIPPALAYGERAVGPIPANSTLIFEIQLLGVKKGQ